MCSHQTPDLASWSWALQPPELWEINACWSHPVYGNLLKPPKETNTHAKNEVLSESLSGWNKKQKQRKTFGSTENYLLKFISGRTAFISILHRYFLPSMPLLTTNPLDCCSSAHVCTWTLSWQPQNVGTWYSVDSAHMGSCGRAWRLKENEFLASKYTAIAYKCLPCGFLIQAQTFLWLAGEPGSRRCKRVTRGNTDDLLALCPSATWPSL